MWCKDLCPCMSLPFSLSLCLCSLSALSLAHSIYSLGYFARRAQALLGIVFGKHFSTLLFLIRKLAKGHTRTPYCSTQDGEQRATSRQIAFKFKTRLLSVCMCVCFRVIYACLLWTLEPSPMRFRVRGFVGQELVRSCFHFGMLAE